VTALHQPVRPRESGDPDHEQPRMLLRSIRATLPVFLLLFTGKPRRARPRATKCLTPRNRIFHKFFIHQNCARSPGRSPRAFFIAALNRADERADVHARPPAAACFHCNQGETNHAVSERPKRQSVRPAARIAQQGLIGPLLSSLFSPCYGPVIEPTRGDQGTVNVGQSAMGPVFLLLFTGKQAPHWKAAEQFRRTHGVIAKV
jgi:hypothetical protein